LRLEATTVLLPNAKEIVGLMPKFEPKIVTTVPPDVGPLLGEIDEIAGAE